MITKRIIPCLYVRDGRVVKGKSCEGWEEFASPVELAKFYSECGADELVFYDITAAEGKTLFADVLKEVASNVFIPLTVGGGMNKTSDFELALSCGADKVSINSGAIKNPSIVEEAAKKYGNQCVVLSVDVKRVNGEFHVFVKGGKEDTGLDAIEWIKRCTDNGAGEIVVNSLDADKEKKGFDVELLKKVCDAVNVPVIASGGADSKEDFVTLFKEIPAIDAGLAASEFHFGKIVISELKDLLAQNNIFVRR